MNYKELKEEVLKQISEHPILSRLKCKIDPWYEKREEIYFPLNILKNIGIDFYILKNLTSNEEKRTILVDINEIQYYNEEVNSISEINIGEIFENVLKTQKEQINEMLSTFEVLTKYFNNEL